MHWAVTTPPAVLNWRGGPGVGGAVLVGGAAGVGLAERVPDGTGDGVGDAVADGESGPLVTASEMRLSSGGIGAGGWTSPPTPPITVSASMLTATEAAAPAVQAAAPVNTLRSAELTASPWHGS
jgi:hypothetical protein